MAISTESAYPFTELNPKRNKAKSPTDTLECTWHFKFRSGRSKIRYNVDIEQHVHDLFIVKFCQDRHRSHRHRYRFLTGEHDSFRVFSTVLKITLAVYHRFPNASFGFVGARSLNETDRARTKRWRLYSRIMTDYFSPEQFTLPPNRSTASTWHSM